MHYSDSSLNAQSSSKQMELGTMGSIGGTKDSKWAMKRRKKAEGQIPREPISHRSRFICVIRKEITARDEGNCIGTRITFLYIMRGRSQRKGGWEAALTGMQADVLKTNCIRTYKILLKKNKSLYHHSYLQSSLILFTSAITAGGCADATDTETNCQLLEFLSTFFPTCNRAKTARGSGSV